MVAGAKLSFADTPGPRIHRNLASRADGTGARIALYAHTRGVAAAVAELRTDPQLAE